MTPPPHERTETIIVLSSLKDTSQIPMREPEWMWEAGFVIPGRREASNYGAQLRT